MSSEKQDIPSPVSENVENYGPVAPMVVDKTTERRLLSKLDKRIVPCIMWMYLMNFMDRGE
jgi:hypothetical protein